MSSITKVARRSNISEEGLIVCWRGEGRDGEGEGADRSTLEI
ncbi:hypothetical protein [Dactylococcopsis salina]|nr:hypothetical protein [Dactylococcopsis salina]